MTSVPGHPMMRPRTRRRYAAMVLLVLAVIGGWSWFWAYSARRAQAAIEGWRAREAAAGRLYRCGSQDFGGYPFRIEVDCREASALLRDEAVPLEIRTARILVATQIYDPTLLISEFTGPLTISDPGRPSQLVVRWRSAQSSLRGTPSAPERGSLVIDAPLVERLDNGSQRPLLRAERIELHGRLADGSVADRPVIEIVLRARQAVAPELSPAAAQPIDGEVRAVLYGLKDFTPKSWAARLREIRSAGGRIEIAEMRVRQGETLAAGSGSLALNVNGRLQGELHMTVAGLEPFLGAIGAARMVQRSPHMEKLAGALNRLAPGLGDVAREQAGANLALGINMLGRPATLEGRPAVAIPLRFDDGAVFLGPIPLGMTPALF